MRVKGCLIAFLITTAVFVLVGFGISRLYHQATEDFPDYARHEAVYEQYGELIGALQESIDVSQSRYDLAARLEKLQLPEQAAYLILTSEAADGFGEETMEVLEKTQVTSKSYTIMNGTGYGKLNGKPVVVISLPVNRHGVDDLYLFLYRPERVPAENAGDVTGAAPSRARTLQPADETQPSK